MDIRNCKRCGKIFQYIGGKPICPVCKDKDEEDYQKVKAYLYDYPKSALAVVSEETGVSVISIKQYIRDERLIIPDDSPIGIDCEGCGVSIKTGRFCKECASRLAGEMSSATRRPELSQDLDKSSNKGTAMHYLNKDRINNN